MLLNLKNKLFTQVDIASIAFFRIIFGAILFYEVFRYYQAGWVWSSFAGLKFYFTFPGFRWVEPLNENGFVILFFITGVLAFMIMIGYLYRLAAFLFFLCFSYIFLVEQSNYLNHFYLICLISFLLIIVPAHRNYSVDAALRPHIKSETIPIWALWLLRFQIAIPYTYGAIAKMNPDWLAGRPLKMWLSNKTDFPIIGRFFQEEWMILLMSRGGLLLDLLMVPFLLYKPTRIYAFLVGVLFHLMNHKLWNIGIFPWFMIAATTIFFEPDWIKDILKKFTFRLPKYDVKQRFNFSSAIWQKCLISFLIIYCSWQLLFPLRHFLIPGITHWTEEAHMFAWHMKLRDKTSEITLFAKDMKTQKEWEIDILKFLSPRQANDMSTHPEMIWQFAHMLEGYYLEKGNGDIAVNALVFSSLNGRKKQLLIDPDLDLTTIPKYRIPNPWIIPLQLDLDSEQLIKRIDIINE